MANIYKSLIKINDSEKQLICIYDNKKKSEKKKESEIPIHSIQIIDRSGSMRNDICQLIEDVKLTIKNLNECDFYSIIYFSGCGQFKTILKCVPAVKENIASSFGILDSIKSTLGMTCFSESIEESGKIIESFSNVCNNFSVTLFTDGRPVTDDWTKEEEYKRVNELLEKLSGNIISFNTIGYGNYCDEKTLESWAMSSDFGEFIHSSDIKEYHDIFNGNLKRDKSLDSDPIEFKILNFQGKQFYYSTSNSVFLMKSFCKFKYSDSKINQFIVILDKNENLEFELNGIKYNSNDVKSSIKESWIESILYKIAYSEYCYGDKNICKNILLKNVGDKYLIDKQILSYSPDEISRFKKHFKDIIFYHTTYRNPGTCNSSYLPDKNANCVLDFLIYLSNESNVGFAIPNDYNRIGFKYTDNFNMFEMNSSPCKGYDIVKLSDVVFNQKNLNVSLKTRIYGYVSVNPIQAKKVGFEDSHINCSIFRTFNVIKDGFLNMNSITIVSNSDVYNDIVNNFNFDNDVISIVDKYKNDIEERIVYSINLEKLPIINESYINLNIDEIVNICEEIEVLKAKIKLSKFLKVQNKNSSEFKNLTPEQNELLKEYGLSSYSNGDIIYNGIDVHKNESDKSNCDYYYSRVFEFQLKGFGSLSQIGHDPIDNKLYLSKNNQRKDRYLNMILYAYNNNALSEDKLNLSDLEQELKYKRNSLCCNKISRALTGNLFNLDDSVEENGVYQYSGESRIFKDELILNVKNSYCKVYY